MDGTLIDPLIGITSSYHHMCAELGIPNMTEEEIRGLIGPSIQDALGAFFEFDQATLGRAIQSFRSYYSEQGILSYTVYPGISDLLATLRDDGFHLHVATNKPLVFANRIVEGAGWTDLFSNVAGSPIDGTTSTKTEIIASVLRQLPPEERTVAYIGDRPEDAEGSHRNGIAFVGVSWGFSTEERLRGAGAVAVVGTAQQLDLVIRDLRAP